MSGGEPSSIKWTFPCAAKVAVLELTASLPGILRVQMWVCDLVMSQSLFLLKIENGKLKIMDNIVEQKSFRFAVRTVNLYKHLCAEKKEFILSKQFLRAGTSIGANVSEAQQAQSRADFLSKLNIALKEATETKYWLRLLHATDYLNIVEYESIYHDCVEIEKLLVSIVKTVKN